MKFNWGTGIFSFLALFLVLSGIFIFFATRQEINLVHKDYYEKGVDHMDQIKVNERSLPYKEAITTSQTEDKFVARFTLELARKIDSGEVYFYRPSDSQMDIKVPLQAKQEGIQIPLADLNKGRYILKLSWYSDKLKYQVDQPLLIE